ncbi:ATP-binding protein [Spirilliplanes yamanashiensis]|uniref:Uncharacterized protein n=1 Tax=Spirilliplanes yamanashiensis TaxID=42233 RepID=A0A8J3Y5J9_9ACTN|nr:BTAD domain-containing putative transcriptional regulator [Spirilliplanes yamanashiensis]MDP9819310.1 DNA-binding SARP family transcriptional activator [Spirilliplanes yamanashiensis]GIJ01867.1 hypothetical protein Sya03_12190 [Spirilliplanes yamanashiensis]
MLIKLAGPVGLEQPGRPPRHLSSAQAQVAFARLVVERAHGTGRDELADTVWPDGLPDTWASALRSVVSRVRAFVTEQDAAEDALVAQGGRYLLRLPADVTVDIEQAEAAVGRAAEAYAAQAFADAGRFAADAVACLERPFLPESAGGWVTETRERLLELLVTGLETAGLAACATGDDRAALRFADSAVRRAPLRESAHRTLMAAHVAAGNRAQALGAYHDLRRVLADELGVDPAPETQAVYLDLLGGPAAPVLPAPRRGRRATAAPFVGRGAELARLAECWEHAGRGDTHVVLIAGEPGIGKTRLATAAARRVGGAGGTVLHGRGDAAAREPYQPLLDAVRGFLAAAGDDAGGEALRAGRAALAAPAEDTLAAALAAAARDRPVLLLLDDLHAAGEAALRLVRDAVARRDGARLLVVATAPAPGPWPDPFAATVRDLDREGWLTRITLTGLGETDAVALARDVVPDGAFGRVPPAHRLVADTAGNPHLLLEVLRAVAAGPGDRGEPAPRVPRGVGEHLTARLAGLDHAPRQLLTAAAVAGPVFELDVTADAAELEPDRAMDCLETLVAAGLVREAPGEGGYRFTHDLLRRALYERATEDRRRFLHTRLADAIEQRRAGRIGPYSEALARHWAAGATPHGDQRAVRWGWRAAVRLAEEGALDEAVRLHRQALDHVPAADAEMRGEAQTNLGLAQLHAGHPGSAQTLFDGALQALHSGRLGVAAQAAIGLAGAVRDEPALRSEAAAVVSTLLDRVTGGDPGDPGDLGVVDDLTLGRLLARHVALGGVVAERTRATAAAMQAVVRELSQLEGPDHAERRAVLADDAAALAAELGDGRAQLLAAHHRAMAAETVGDCPARERALAALGAAVRAAGDDPVGDALILEHRVATAVAHGRFADAEETARRAGDGGAGGAGIFPAPGTMAGRQMHVAAWLRAMTWTDPGRRRPDIAQAVEQSLATLLAGERGLPHLTVRALATGAQPLPPGDEWLHVGGLLGLGAVELGDRTTAEALRELFAPYADLNCGVGYRSYVGPMAFHLGRLSVVVGDWSAAERHLTAALAMLGERGAQPWIALALRSLADALQGRDRAGDRASAAALRAEAATTLTSLGIR